MQNDDHVEDGEGGFGGRGGRRRREREPGAPKAPPLPSPPLPPPAREDETAFKWSKGRTRYVDIQFINRIQPAKA